MGSIPDWIKGIALALMASFCTGFSKIIIRKSWLMEKNNNNNNDHEASQQFDSLLGASETQRPNHHSKLLRYSGMAAIFILNPFFNIMALNYASPALLAPFDGTNIIWVICFSSILLGEKKTYSEIAACILIWTGQFIVVLFGDHTNDEGVSTRDVITSYTETATILYFVVLGLYLALCFYWIHRSDNSQLQQIAWGTCGGTITGPQCFIKDALIIVQDVTGKGDPIPWFLPIMILCAAACAITGLFLESKCLKRYNATFSEAGFVGSFVVSSSINAAAHYHTFENLPTLLNVILYPFGLIVLVTGVFILNKGTSIHEGEVTSEDVQNENHCELPKLV